MRQLAVGLTVLLAIVAAVMFVAFLAGLAVKVSAWVLGW